VDVKAPVSQLERVLGWLVIVTCTFTAIAVASLHVLQPGLNPFASAISEYVHGPHGFLMTATFFSQSLGSLALAAIVLWRESSQRRNRLGGVLFIISAFGAAVAGVFPADLASPVPQTTDGAIHATAGLMRFLALAIALPLLSPMLAENHHSATAARALPLLAYGFVAVFVVSIFVLANIDLFGLGQRAFISVLLVWMSIAAYPLVRRKQG
jgi:hypothetical membrane protein